MGKQKFDRMKKTLSILMLVFVVVSITAVAASARDGGRGDGGRGGHGHGGWGGGFGGGWGGPGFGWGDPFGFYPLHPTAPHLDLAHVDLMDASVHLTTHTLFRLS